MAKVFAITASDDSVDLTSGPAEVAFTVSNTSGGPIRGRARAMPLGSTQAEWLSVAGESERDFSKDGTHQFTVRIQAPPGTARGRYSFRLDVVSVHNPDEDFAEGQSVAFRVPASQQPDPGPFPWWIVAVAAGVILLIGGIILWVVLSNGAENEEEIEEEPRSEEEASPAGIGTIVPGSASSETVNVENISMSPVAPATLTLGTQITIGFQYTSNEAGGIRIFVRPMTAGALSGDYAASGSPVYSASSGSGTANFTIRNGPKTIDQIRFRVMNSDQSNLLEEFFVVVDYTFTD